MFHPRLFDNARADGFGVLEVVPEGNPEREEPRSFVPLKRTELSGEVVGPLGDLCLTQVFGYTSAECGKTLEALYRFPLPGDAAVCGVIVRFGEVEIRAELKEREQAEADYEEAKRQGRQAALATRESPDVFTLRVAGLQPDQEVRVETAYVQLARMEGADWTLRIPLTTSPRYVRADECNSRHAQGQPLALLRDPGHRFSLDLLVEDAASVASPTHALSVVSEETGRRVRLSDGSVLPDRDCVLSWRTAQQDQHPALHLYLHEEKTAGTSNAGDIYFMALAAPPKQRTESQDVPREIVLLVDHSGSMHGAKWEASDWAVKQFLASLTAKDTFALGLFHNTVTWFAGKPKHADGNTVEAAIAFLESRKDSGGTELGVALEQALGQERRGGEVSRHVLIVTDAEVSDSGRILRLAETEFARSDRRRISVLCIDAAPNSFLVKEMAERGGGIAKFLTSAPEEEDITTALDRILEDWSAPVLTGLRLEVNRPNAAAVGRSVLKSERPNSSVIDLGDLPAGRAVWIAGRVPRGGSADLAFRLTTSNGKEAAARRCDLDTVHCDRPGLKALFGASRVLALEFLTTSYFDEKQLNEQLARLGYDPKKDLESPAESSAVYAENIQRDAEKALKGLLVREALRYGLASSETAFVAVRTEAGKPVDATSVVANALPSGWAGDFEFSAGSATGVAGFAMGADFAMPAPAPAQMLRAVANVKSRRVSSAGYAVGAPPPSPAGRPPTGAAPPATPSIGSAISGIVDAVSGLFGGGKTPNAAPAGAAPAGLLAQTAHPPIHSKTPLFSGKPVFAGPEAVLFDTGRPSDAQTMTGFRNFSQLLVQLGSGSSNGSVLDTGLTLLVYIDDMASPRARVRLSDILKQGGIRPIHLQRQDGQVVRIVLDDPNGVWQQNAPEIAVTLQ